MGNTMHTLTDAERMRERSIPGATIEAARKYVRKEGLVSKDNGDRLVRTSPQRMVFTFFEAVDDEHNRRIIKQQIIFIQEGSTLRMVGLADTSVGKVGYLYSLESIARYMRHIKDGLNNFVGERTSKELR